MYDATDLVLRTSTTASLRSTRVDVRCETTYPPEFSFLVQRIPKDMSNSNLKDRASSRQRQKHIRTQSCAFDINAGSLHERHCNWKKRLALSQGTLWALRLSRHRRLAQARQAKQRCLLLTNQTRQARYFESKTVETIYRKAHTHIRSLHKSDARYLE